MKRRTLMDFSFTRGTSEKKRKEREEEVEDDAEDETGDGLGQGAALAAHWEPSASGSAATYPTPECSKSGQKGRLFQNEWTKKWPWLQRNDSGGMLCDLCVKHKKANPFTTDDGCTNFRTSTLERHAESSSHQLAMRAEVMQKEYLQAADNATKRNLSGADAGVLAAMRTVHWMAEEDLPIKKYSSLMGLLKVQGCDAVSTLSVSGNATYMSRTAGQEFQTCVAEAIHQRVTQNIRDASMYSVLIDESTDIATSKHMVIYVRVVGPDFVPHTYFLRNITVDNPRSDAVVLFSYIKKTWEEENLDFGKVYGFGSDGANVMVGKSHSVSALIKKENPHCINIHCMAHRLNLATSQASKNIPFMKEVEQKMSDLYYYFGGSKSGNRKCELEQIQKVLGDPLLKMKECHEIRWLSFFEAVRAVHTCWTSLYTYFSTHENSKTKPLMEMFSQYKFLAVLALLINILPSVCQLSLILQKQDLDISCVEPALASLHSKIKQAKKGTTHYQNELKEKLEKKRDSDGDLVKLKYKGKKLNIGTSLASTSKEIEEIRVAFCDSLTQNISNRFPRETSDVSAAFGVLAMRPLTFLSPDEQAEYGVKELKILTDFYGKKAQKGDRVSEPLIKPDECMEEWSLAKQTVLLNRYPRESTRILYRVLFDYHRDQFPNLLLLANMALILPLQTADCERGFSCQNGMKTARRSRLAEDSLNTLMTIKCEGGPVADHDFSAALGLWKGKKNRRLVKK